MTPPGCLTISQSENYAQADHIPFNPLLHLAFKSVLPNPFRHLEVFWELRYYFLSQGPSVNLSQLQLSFLLVPHCALGTETCSNTCYKASVIYSSSPAHLLRAVLPGFLELLLPRLEVLEIPTEENICLNFKVVNHF